MKFKDRREAGILLAGRLEKYKSSKYAIVLAIPRGGVEIGYEIAKNLDLRLEIIVTKKIGLPENDEFAIGSVGPNGSIIIDDDAVKIYNLSKEYIEAKKKELSREIKRRHREYMGKNESSILKGKIVILADDGIATGYTARSAIISIKMQQPKKIILAVPIAPKIFADDMKKYVDDIVCLNITDDFFSVSQFYENFSQLDDNDVKGYISQIRKEPN